MKATRDSHAPSCRRWTSASGKRAPTPITITTITGGTTGASQNEGGDWSRGFRAIPHTVQTPDPLTK